jgi:hypothetical protein
MRATSKPICSRWPLVEVEWVDANAYAEWTLADYAKQQITELDTNVTIGYLVEQTETAWLLVQTSDKARGCNYGGRIIIPREMIIKHHLVRDSEDVP